jgi:hypothetical protein
MYDTGYQLVDTQRGERYTQLVNICVRVTQQKVATRPERAMHYAKERQVGGETQNTAWRGGAAFAGGAATQECIGGEGGGGERGGGSLQAAYDIQSD